MESTDWSMKPRHNDSRNIKLTKLNEDIRTWEKGFELEHRRPPKREDILTRPFIRTLPHLRI
jgi:hypothetical protein